MPKNWNRHFELQLVDDNGEGISLSDFKVTFEIERNDNRWPAVATVKVYNLAAETQSRIMKREYTKITIIAGYDGLDTASRQWFPQAKSVKLARHPQTARITRTAPITASFSAAILLLQWTVKKTLLITM
jgi:hypothetical protein